MTPAAIIRGAAADGVSLILSPAGTIKAAGDQEAVDRWLPVVRENKPGIVKALGQPPVSKRRGLDGYGTPPGVPPLGDCALARQIRAMNRAARPAMLDDDPVPGDEASAMPHVSFDAEPPNLPGVSPKFAARLSAEDLEDIKAGDIPVKTVQAFEAAAVARESEDLREAFEERSAVLQHDAGLEHAEAELESARLTAALAQNRSCSWASLRASLAGYPELLSQVPDRPGWSILYPGARPRSTCALSPAPSRAVLSSPRPSSRPRARAAPW